MIEEGSEFLTRTCASCLNWNWDDQGVLGRNRKRYATVQLCREATGKDPWERIAKTVPPCYKCPKIPKDEPVKSYYYAVEITERTWQTIQHFEQCAAVGQFPINPATGEVDAIVRRNAAIIRGIKDAYRRKEQQEIVVQIAQVMGVKLTYG